MAVEESPEGRLGSADGAPRPDGSAYSSHYMPQSSLSALQCADFSTTLLSVFAQLLSLSKKACPVFAQVLEIQCPIKLIEQDCIDKARTRNESCRLRMHSSLILAVLFRGVVVVAPETSATAPVMLTLKKKKITVLPH